MSFTEFKNHMFIVDGFWVLCYTLSYFDVRVRNLLAHNIDDQNTKYVFCILGHPNLQ